MADHFERLSQAAQSPPALEAYIEGGGLRSALAAIASDELGAARKALDFADKSAAGKHSAVGKALTRLQVAHESYQKAHQLAAQGWRKDVCMDAVAKDIFTCCAIALCHAYLGNDSEAIERALAEADRAFESSIYLSDRNVRDRRAATTPIDTLVGSFLARLERADLTHPDTFELWRARGARVTDALLAAVTVAYNAINPFYYKHLAKLRRGSLRVKYADFARMRAHLKAALAM